MKTIDNGNLEIFPDNFGQQTDQIKNLAKLSPGLTTELYIKVNKRDA